MSGRSLLSLQGYIKIGLRTAAGKPGALYWVGSVPEATIELVSESASKNESFTGQRVQYGKLNTGKTGTLNLTLDEWSARNIAMGLYSEVLNTVAGTVTDEALPADLVVGDEVRLDHPYASDLVLTDSTPATPQTVDAGHYRVTGHNDSVIELLDLTTTPYVQPLLAAYSHEAYDSVECFTQNAKDRYVLFDGINTETGDPVLVDLYRVNFDPIGNLGLIHAEYGNLPMTGAILFDELNVDADGKGGYFRVRQKSAVA